MESWPRREVRFACSDSLPPPANMSDESALISRHAVAGLEASEATPTSSLLFALSNVVIALSLLGCASIVLTYVRYSELRTRARQVLFAWNTMEGARLLLLLSSSSGDFLLAKSYLRSVALLWPAAFMLHICWTVVGKEPVYGRKKLRALYVACFALPAAALLVGAVTSLDEHNPSTLDGAIVRAALVDGDVWAVAGIVAMPLVYHAIERHIKLQVWVIF